MKADSAIKSGDINIREPFVLVREARYYRHGSCGGKCWDYDDGDV